MSNIVAASGVYSRLLSVFTTRMLLTSTTLNVYGTANHIFFNTLAHFTNTVPGTLASPPAAPGQVCDKDTPGALPLPASAGEIRIVRARSMTDMNNGNRSFFVCDRLVESGGLSGTVTTAQTLNTIALPARAPANGVGVYAAIELLQSNVASGAVALAYSLTYTNQDNVQKTVTGTHGNWNSVREFAKIVAPLAPGDTGVRQVNSVTFTNAATAAVSLGVTLFRPIMMFDAGPSIEHANPVGGDMEDWLKTSLPAFPPTAFVEIDTWGDFTGAATIWPELDLVVD